ncbi:MAG: 16S rRNA (guanine(966)-N(2))-methyltransferase RsmD [Deltaproteobacteria bacterium]|nr:16S rRNA (guanine(966)-N(2))-methyltransferase RsmD [Deltaproteobacteria bacterium]
MRIIAGNAKGRRLKSPKGQEIRPVLDQVKEAIFNILWDVTDFTVLDLFAGTGSMGIEAISRGAQEVVFVDNLPASVRLIRDNLRICQMMEQGKVLKQPVGKAIATLSKQNRSFDLIFVDPPYLKRFVNRTLRKLAESPLVHEKTIIITEHHPKEPIEESNGLTLTDQRKYGQTVISFLKKNHEK